MRDGGSGGETSMGYRLAGGVSAVANGMRHQRNQHVVAFQPWLGDEEVTPAFRVGRDQWPQIGNSRRQGFFQGDVSQGGPDDPDAPPSRGFVENFDGETFDGAIQLNRIKRR